MGTGYWSRQLCRGGVVVALSAAAGTAFAGPDFSTAGPAWTPWVEFGGYYGSDNASRGEMVLWAPLGQDASHLLFMDLRGKLFDGGFLEGNFAVGGRAMLESGWNAGIWGGYDIRKSSTGNVFHQLSGGVEFLGEVVDVRLNGYVPLNASEGAGTTSSSSTEVMLINSNSDIAMVTDTVTMTSTEVALGGFDGEVGVKLPLSGGAGGSGPGAVLALYGGGFYFDHADLDEAVAGPKGRAELRFNGPGGSRLTIEGEASWDPVRDLRWEAGARLRIPLGGVKATAGAALPGQWWRMTEGIERDTDIVTTTTATETTTTATESVEDALTGVDLEQVTFATSETGVTTPSSTAGAKTLVIATGGGEIEGEQTLQGDQTLLAAGVTLTVRGLVSGTEADFTFDGTAPTLVAASESDDILTLAGNNTHVAGVSIGNPDGHSDDRPDMVGIRVGSNKSNVVIDRVTVSDIDGLGIRINDHNSGILVTGSSITDTARSGIFIGANNVGPESTAGVTVEDTTLTRTASGLDRDVALGVTDESIVRIANVTIDGGAADADNSYKAFVANSSATITLDGVKLTGHFDSDVLTIADGVTLSGGGTSDATHGGEFCITVGSQTGSLDFGTAGSCPPP